MDNNTKLWVLLLLAILGILFSSPLVRRNKTSRKVFKILSILMWLLLVVLMLSMPGRPRW